MEIAEALELPLETAKSRLACGLARLREQLGPLVGAQDHGPGSRHARGPSPKFVRIPASAGYRLHSAGRPGRGAKGIAMKNLVTANAGLLLAMLLVGCDSSGQNMATAEGEGANSAAAATETANAAAPASNASSEPPAGEEKVLKSEQVEAVFTGWEVGDYMWAKLDVQGREPVGAWADAPIDSFLQAHKGRKLIVRLDTVMADIPEAGGETEVERVAEARLGNLTAQAWWQSLSPAERQSATRSLEAAFAPSPPS